MRRREFLATAAAAMAVRPHPVAVLISVHDGTVMRSMGEPRRLSAAPGSTIKPIAIAALLRASKLHSDEVYVCPGTLRLGTHQMACSHPRLGRPLNVSEVIAYSCNCAVAHYAERFSAGELARYLEAKGIAAKFVGGAQQQLEALGEEDVEVTPYGLAQVYARLREAVIVAGLEGAVQYGTAQAAALVKTSIAGKTGSVRTSSGMHAAWFAGFAPSREPQVAIAVFTQGLSGGADAAPVAREMLREYFG